MLDLLGHIGAQTADTSKDVRQLLQVLCHVLKHARAAAHVLNGAAKVPHLFGRFIKVERFLEILNILLTFANILVEVPAVELHLNNPGIFIPVIRHYFVTSIHASSAISLKIGSIAGVTKSFPLT